MAIVEEDWIKIINTNIELFYCIPKNDLTTKLFLEAIKIDFNCCSKVPRKLVTLELYEASEQCYEDIYNNMINLPGYDESYNYNDYDQYYSLTAEQALLSNAQIQLDAICNVRFEIFKKLPEDVLTAEICEKAVKENTYIFTYVPEQFRTYSMYVEAIEKKIESSFVSDIPEKFKTYELYLAFLNSYNYLPSNMPKRFETEELYLLKIEKTYGNQFEDLPTQFNNSDFYKKVIKRKPSLFNQIPKRFLTEEFCLEAIRADINRYWSSSISSKIPKNILTKDFYTKAVKIDGSIIEYMPKEFLTENMYMDAIKTGRIKLSSIPSEFVTYQMCMESVKHNDGYKDYRLKYVPDEMIDLALCLEAVKNCGKNLKHVPAKFATYEVCLEALLQDFGACKYMNYQHMSTEFLIDVAKEDYKIGDYIIHHGYNCSHMYEYMTYEFILCVTKQCGYIPGYTKSKYILRLINDLPLTMFIGTKYEPIVLCLNKN